MSSAVSKSVLITLSDSPNLSKYKPATLSTSFLSPPRMTLDCDKKS